MTKETAIKLFKSKNVRTAWDDENEKWYFSIVDVVAILTESSNPRNYWKVLKHRLLKEGNKSVTNCNQLKMESADGKSYLKRNQKHSNIVVKLQNKAVLLLEIHVNK